MMIIIMMIIILMGIIAIAEGILSGGCAQSEDPSSWSFQTFASLGSCHKHRQDSKYLLLAAARASGPLLGPSHPAPQSLLVCIYNIHSTKSQLSHCTAKSLPASLHRARSSLEGSGLVSGVDMTLRAMSGDRALSASWACGETMWCAQKLDT